MMPCWNIQGLNTKKDQVLRDFTHITSILQYSVKRKRKVREANTRESTYLYFGSSVDKSKRAKAGVAIVTEKKLMKNVVYWNVIDERIIMVNIKLKGLTIIGVYAPTVNSDINTKANFFDELSEQLNRTKNKEGLILMDNFNDRIGKYIDNKIVRCHGEDVVNDNGTRWIEMCVQHSLKILNGFFQHKEINKYTWIQKTKNRK